MQYLRDCKADLHQFFQEDSKWAAIEKLIFWFLNFFGDGRRAVSSGEVRKLVMESPAKSCSLDPMPTYVFRDCLDALLPFLTALINSGQVHLCEVWHDEAPWIKIPSALPTCSLLQPC